MGRDARTLVAVLATGGAYCGLASMSPRDTWTCANCWHEGALDRAGRCEACGSDAVLPVELLERAPEPVGAGR